MKNEEFDIPWLHIGTSGWSYAHWSGIFYPAGLKPYRYLEYYINRFNCVELNASFYHLPLRATVEGWKRRTPESFLICPKLSRYITHQLRLINTNDALEKFFKVFEGMKEKLGPILIQLPPGLKYEKSLVGDFLDALKNNYDSFRFALEVRSKSWIRDELLDELTHAGIAFVIADSGKRFPNYVVATTDFVYLRFHGRENLYASDYNDAILEEYAGKIAEWHQDKKEVWAFFNNDFNGYAPQNAERLREMVSNANQLPRF